MIERNDYALVGMWPSHADVMATRARALTAMGQCMDRMRVAAARWEAVPYEERQSHEGIAVSMALDEARADEHVLNLILMDLARALSDALERKSRPHDLMRRSG